MLANEFQQKQVQQAEEIRAQLLPTQEGPKESPEDTLIVRNILVGDDTEVEEVIPYANPKRDPSSVGKPYDFSQPDSQIYQHTWNTKDFFEVRWDGRPHRIAPGQTRFFPRYLADHFAKNLIDFILIQREEKEKVQGLLKNRLERKKLYDQIIEGVASYYNGDELSNSREGLRIERQVEAMNQTPAFNVGEVPNPALGYGTTDKPPEKIEDVEVPATNQKFKNQEEMIAARSIGELRSEAKRLGIEVKPTLTKEQLAAAILNF